MMHAEEGFVSNSLIKLLVLKKETTKDCTITTTMAPVLNRSCFFPGCCSRSRCAWPSFLLIATSPLQKWSSIQHGRNLCSSPCVQHTCRLIRIKNSVVTPLPPFWRVTLYEEANPIIFCSDSKKTCLRNTLSHSVVLCFRNTLLYVCRGYIMLPKIPEEE